MDTRELQGLRYRCLEDCGFCCTFTPEVSPPELVALRAKLPVLPVVRSGETTLLSFQGGCGACTLLKDRKCTAYEERPAHCRYFPFHIYFGRQTEAYVNRSCRGVQVDPAGSLEGEFKQQVLDLVTPFRIAKAQDKANTVHAAFERNAKEAGVWGDVDGALERLASHGAAWFDPANWPAAGESGQEAQPGEAGTPAEAWEVALRPFSEEDPVARPYLVGKDLQWRGFKGNADGIEAQTLTESGTLTTYKQLGAFRDWPKLPPAVEEALAEHLAYLASRDLFAGSIFSLVDETEYAVHIHDAARIRVGDTAADLALRADILHRMGIPWEEIPDEVARFYDSAFLDVETIGGWL